MSEHKSLIKLFDTPDARFAKKALDYLDGKQLSHVITLLNDNHSGRRQWKEKGMRPASRNITRMVIEKSGQLFKDGAPVMEVYVGKTANDSQSAMWNDALKEIYFNEFMKNLDEVVRELKTGLIYTQIDSDTDEMIMDILHQGNCILDIDPVTRKPIKLTYLTYEDEEESMCYFRIVYNDKIEYWKEEKGGTTGAEFIDDEENPYNHIPVTIFYDTNLPRTGVWNHIPRDLVNLNEMYNMHMVDMDFAASWSIHKTLFTNCAIKTATQGSLETSEYYNEVVPRQSINNDGLLGGLSKIVTLDTNGIDTPFVEYKGPDLDLKQPAELYSMWVRDFAADWGVNVKFAGDGSAQSGFQLIVEEMDNLELRQQRSRQFEQGLARLFECIKILWNYHYASKFSDDSKLVVTFAEPKLPVDKKNQEEVWSIRIQENRATIVDYHMEVHGMTKEEATAKAEEDKEFNKTNSNEILINQETDDNSEA